MGNSSSTETEDTTQNIETLGYRVLGVQPDSPASQAGLVSFFDFLLGCNDRMLLDEEEDIDFVQVLKDSIGKELELLVFNIKSESTRLVQMTPSDSWGGHGLLGVTIRLDDYAHADERLIRILSVSPNSPAHIAGLHPLKDYLLGTSTVSFSSDLILCDVLEEYEEKVIEVYVYNTDSDEVRVVNLMPSVAWGDGEGLLGAEVGTGYLHRLPFSCRATVGKSMEREVTKVRLLDDDIDASDNYETLVDLTSLSSGTTSTMVTEDDDDKIPIGGKSDTVVQQQAINEHQSSTKPDNNNANIPTTSTTSAASSSFLPPPPLSGAAPVSAPLSSLPLPPPPIMKKTAVN